VGSSCWEQNKNRALSLQLGTQGGDTEVATLVNWWFDSTLGHTSQVINKRSSRSTVEDEVRGCNSSLPDAGIRV
jgi:hypothetical protein